MNHFFSGRGKSPLNSYDSLPRVNNDALKSPENYLCTKALAAAVETSILLGMPLLLTGEPGCGKSQLAYRIAWEIGFPESQPIRFSVKSTTEAKDLFYTFDTVGRFHAAQSKHDGDNNTQAEAKNYIQYQALGLALLKAKGRNAVLNDPLLQEIWTDIGIESLPAEAQRSVVLLDEIDKAPRDVPNDILNEIEEMAFDIPELGISKKIGLEGEEKYQRPIVIITSNSERDLPEAFLRRCVYHHVHFPPYHSDDSEEVTIEKIIYQRFQSRFPDNSSLVKNALSLCEFLRNERQGLTKPPSLAELINWLDFLDKRFKNLDHAQALSQLAEKDLKASVANNLLKTSSDQQMVEKLVDAWLGEKD